MAPETIQLTGVQETLLLPLWGRAMETKKTNPLLVDKTAVRIIESIDYDFSIIEKKTNPLSCASWIARSLYFDSKIKAFLEAHPDGSVINVGCGLDTTYERVNNQQGRWYELDFPEVIDVRKQYIKEDSGRQFLPYSVFDEAWYDQIENKKQVFIMIAGVIYYFNEEQVRNLFLQISQKFETSEAAFDYSSKRGVRIANKKVIDDGGMDQSAYLQWGIEDIREIEKWSGSLHVVHNMKMFAEHKKKFPITKRLGMMISDALSVMSLAHVKIEA